MYVIKMTALLQSTRYVRIVCSGLYIITVRLGILINCHICDLQLTRAFVVCTFVFIDQAVQSYVNTK